MYIGEYLRKALPNLFFCVFGDSGQKKKLYRGSGEVTWPNLLRTSIRTISGLCSILPKHPFQFAEQLAVLELDTPKIICLVSYSPVQDRDLSANDSRCCVRAWDKLK